LPRTIHFVSLGCPKNRVDTEVLAGVAAQAGYELVGDADAASVIVVNTCGFIGPAKEESVDTILEMAEHRTAGRCERLVVAGCLAQRHARELAAEIPEIDNLLGTSDLLALGAVLSGEGVKDGVGEAGRFVYAAETPRLPSTLRHTAYVKIAEGCSRRCAFCVIPSMRGDQRSRPVDDVVREVEALVSGGVVEVNLVSQDTVSYGRDLAEKTTLAALVGAVARVPGVRWLRLHYLYPQRLTDELVDVVASEPTVVKYVDMPLQHASTRMLGVMRRGVGGDRQKRLLARLRERIPGVVLRTSFIVGHPGETEADFEELMELVESERFDHVGVFRYSDEEGTPAAELPDKVPAKVASRRHRALMALQKKIARQKNRARVGQTLDVLVEGGSDESEFLLEGRHAGQAPEVDGKVYLTDGTARPGEIRRATVVQASDYDLVASLDAIPSADPIRIRPPRVRLPVAGGTVLR
jgi:ribosomal protein S12 methylthiotransferase